MFTFFTFCSCSFLTYPTSRGRWGSWNCAGCSNTGSAKARGFSVCDHNSADMCYDSCEAGVSAGAPGGHESKTCPKTDFLGKGECDWCTCVDDISFVVAMTTKLRSELCIDERRMHSTGMSNGGMMAYQVRTMLLLLVLTLLRYPCCCYCDVHASYASR